MLHSSTGMLLHEYGGDTSIALFLLPSPAQILTSGSSLRRSDMLSRIYVYDVARHDIGVC